MKISIADGRGALWQWDTGRRVKITDGDGVKQVHYQNRCFGRSVDVDVGNDGTAIIPDELLQDCHTLTAYVYVTDDTGAYTMEQQDFIVHKRAKPAGYVYTPTDQMTLQTIQSQIGDLSDLTTEAKDTLVAAINEAARTGGGAGSMDLRVAGGYVQYSTDGGMTWTNLIAMAELKGADGITPHIGDNGNWYLGTTDTGKPSRGEKGDTGEKGEKGDTGATGPQGPKGDTGMQALKVKRATRATRAISAVLTTTLPTNRHRSSAQRGNLLPHKSTMLCQQESRLMCNILTILMGLFLLRHLMQQNRYIRLCRRLSYIMTATIFLLNWREI